MTVTAAAATHQITVRPNPPAVPAGARTFQHTMAPLHRTLLDPEADPADRLAAMTGYIPANEILTAQVYLDRLLPGLDYVRRLGLEHGTRLLDYILAAHIGTALEELPAAY